VTNDDGGAERASAVRSANSGGARPSSCGPVRGAPLQWGLRPGLLVSDFGLCNFCVLDLKKKIVKILN